MNTLPALTKPVLLASCIAFGLGTSSLLAADFRSIYTFDQGPVPTNPLVNRVVVNFSTDESSGEINAGDLTDWSIELLNGTTSVYIDNVIANGVVQDIGGISRTLEDIRFGFDLDDLQYTDGFNNDSSFRQINAAFGPTYKISGNERIVDFFRFLGNNGTLNSGNATEFLNGSGLFADVELSTEELADSEVIPEPSTIIGLLAVGCLGALTRKRK